MKVSIKSVCGNEVTVNVSSAFKILVDGEVLLEHSGPVACVAQGPLRGSKSPYSPGSDASSLFSSSLIKERTDYIQCSAPNSSFIDSFQWWAWDEALGANSLEIYFTNGNFVSYAQVPFEVADGFRKAIESGESAGRYFNAHIKHKYEVISEGGE